MIERLPGNVVRVAPSGDLDVTTVDAVREALTVAEAGAAAVVIDLTGVEFLDSAGLHLVFATVRRFDEAGIARAFVVPRSSPVWRVVEVAGLALAAPVHESLDGALGALDLEVGARDP